MIALRNLVLPSSAIAIAAALATGAGVSAAPAKAPQKVTPKGVGAVKLGARYDTLHRAGRVGTIGAGCEPGGPKTRSAPLNPPLKGSVDVTSSAVRRIASITIRGGATARGIGMGSTQAKLRHAFPKAHFDHSLDKRFGSTVVSIPKGAGGRLQFIVDTKTKKVTLIGIPRIPFCE